jgi:hypothetical protein
VFPPSIARDFKPPLFVLPSVLFNVLPSESEASITSFGTALPDGIKGKLRATAEELAQKHFHFSPLWLTKGGMGLKF